MSKPEIEALLQNLGDPTCLRIGIGGGSGSGKSTVAALIKDQLDPPAVDVLRLDQFFKPVDEMPRYESSYHGTPQPDFNQPDSLKVDEMVAHCREIESPEVVIFDGHFSLYYPGMRELMDIKCFVSVDAEVMLQRRTERNLANNYGGSRENILHYNRECVLPSYEQHIFPTHRHADILIPNGDSETRKRDAMIRSLCQSIRGRVQTADRQEPLP